MHSLTGSLLMIRAVADAHEVHNHSGFLVPDPRSVDRPSGGAISDGIRSGIRFGTATNCTDKVPEVKFKNPIRFHTGS